MNRRRVPSIAKARRRSLFGPGQSGTAPNNSPSVAARSLVAANAAEEEKRDWFRRRLERSYLADVSHASSPLELRPASSVRVRQHVASPTAAIERVISTLLDLNRDQGSAGCTLGPTFWEQALQLCGRLDVDGTLRISESLLRRLLDDVFASGHGSLADCTHSINRADLSSKSGTSVLCSAVRAISRCCSQSRKEFSTGATFKWLEADGPLDTAVSLVCLWLDHHNPSEDQHRPKVEGQQEQLLHDAEQVLGSLFIDCEPCCTTTAEVYCSVKSLEELTSSMSRWRCTEAAPSFSAHLHRLMSCVPYGEMEGVEGDRRGVMSSIKDRELGQRVGELLDDEHRRQEVGEAAGNSLYWVLLLHCFRLQSNRRHGASSIAEILQGVLGENSRLAGLAIRLSRLALFWTDELESTSQLEDTPIALRFVCETLLPSLGRSAVEFTKEEKLLATDLIEGKVLPELWRRLPSAEAQSSSADSSESRLRILRWAVCAGLASRSFLATENRFAAPNASSPASRSRFDVYSCYFVGLLLIRSNSPSDNLEAPVSLHCRALWHWWTQGKVAGEASDGELRVHQWCELYVMPPLGDGKCLLAAIAGRTADETTGLRLRALLVLASVAASGVLRSGRWTSQIVAAVTAVLWGGVESCIYTMLESSPSQADEAHQLVLSSERITPLPVSARDNCESRVALGPDAVSERLLLLLTREIRRADEKQHGLQQQLLCVVHCVEPFCSGDAALGALGAAGQPIPPWTSLLAPMSQARALADVRALSKVVWSPAHRGVEWAVACQCFALMDRYRVASSVDHIKSVAAALLARSDLRSPETCNLLDGSVSRADASVVFHWLDQSNPSIVSTSSQRSSDGLSSRVKELRALDQLGIQLTKQQQQNVSQSTRTGGDAMMADDSSRVSAIQVLRQLVLDRAKPSNWKHRHTSAGHRPIDVIEGLHWTEALRLLVVPNGAIDATVHPLLPGDVLRLCCEQRRWEAATLVLSHLVRWNTLHRPLSSANEEKDNDRDNGRLLTASRSTLGKAMQLITSTGPPNVAWKIALRFWQSMALDAAFPVADLMALATPLMNRCVLFALRRGQQWAISLELVAKMAATAIPIEFQHVAEVLACCLEAGAPLSTVQLCLRRHMSLHGGAGEDDGPLMLRIACAATANVDSNKTGNSDPAAGPCLVTQQEPSAAELLLMAFDTQSKLGRGDAWSSAILVLRDLLRGGHVDSDGHVLVSPRCFGSTVSAALHADRWDQALCVLRLQTVLQVDVHSSILYRVLSTCSGRRDVSLATWAQCLSLFHASWRRVPLIHQQRITDRIFRLLGKAGQLGTHWQWALEGLCQKGTRGGSPSSPIISGSICESLILDRGVSVDIRLDARRRMASLNLLFPVSVSHAIADSIFDLCEDLQYEETNGERLRRETTRGSSTAAARTTLNILRKSFKQLSALPPPDVFLSNAGNTTVARKKDALIALLKVAEHQGQSCERVRNLLLQVIMCFGGAAVEEHGISEPSFRLSVGDDVHAIALIAARAFSELNDKQMKRARPAGSDGVAQLRTMSGVFRALGDQTSADALVNLVALMK